MDAQAYWTTGEHQEGTAEEEDAVVAVAASAGPGTRVVAGCILTCTYGSGTARVTSGDLEAAFSTGWDGVGIGHTARWSWGRNTVHTDVAWRSEGHGGAVEKSAGVAL